MVDVQCLSDYELQKQLEKLGFSPGPILPSTRKVYEKKLVQLLVSPPCAPPVMNGPREPDGPQGSDDELNIILKGNITFSTKKSKEPKKNPVFEIRKQQEETVKPNCDYNNSRMIAKAAPFLVLWLFRGLFSDSTYWRLQVIHLSGTQSRTRERPEAPIIKPKAVDVYHPAYKPSRRIRCAARAPNIRIKGRTVPRETAGCQADWSMESAAGGFPAGLKLAVLGIVLIVVFVYITVEKKPLFG
ncbi:LEM domain-containing protein 1 isoform X1 [Tupaia chinensis]|uniref:LEM domain-containing protein 1 isoform X1 n=1 Tax=Tupaia chinensis TaxID=246437 RepID=UPI000703EEA4|nr:LEM domain-containing protein 1 isoform X1 [Tupaia chinensis]